MHLHLYFLQPLIRTNINIINIQVYSCVKAVLISRVVVLHIHFYNTKALQPITNVGGIDCCLYFRMVILG